MSKSRVVHVPLETVGACALRKGKSPSAVRAAISTGRLPAISASAPNGRSYYLVRPADADGLWDHPVGLNSDVIGELLKVAL